MSALSVASDVKEEEKLGGAGGVGVVSCESGCYENCSVC